ncbi:unnamed protein product, partial [Iphiclides podalirius]
MGVSDASPVDSGDPATHTLASIMALHDIEQSGPFTDTLARLPRFRLSGKSATSQKPPASHSPARIREKRFYFVNDFAKRRSDGANRAKECGQKESLTVQTLGERVLCARASSPTSPTRGES